MADLQGSMTSVAVVYAQQEYSVQVAVESNKSINVEVFQCQLLSLLGLLPDEQILSTDAGVIIASPLLTEIAQPLVSPEKNATLRVFVAKTATDDGNAIAVPPDHAEICTRCTFGDLPVVQPAFHAIGVDPGVLICQVCARTCCNDAQVVSPLEWSTRARLHERFISEIRVVAGEVDVMPPRGFERVQGDLNYSASGDYVHLFVKRGGSHAVTHVTIHRAPRDKTSDGSKHVTADINSGNASDVSLCITSGATSATEPANKNVYAITDLSLIIGTVVPPDGFIRIPQNLNEGALGKAVQPIYLCYKLAPLGGFACAAKHGVFGECLFHERHQHGTLSAIAAGASQEADTELKALKQARTEVDDAILQSHYRQHEPAMRSRLQSGMDRARTYEDPRMQAEALKRIPVEKLHERARANPNPQPSYHDELVMQLTHWFKREFFSWMNQPTCSVCSHPKTQLVRTEGPSTVEEKAGQASRVEVYQCPQCRGFTRFPRYNDPVKLLDTKTGRCGEWANCFTLCCRAMGFEARYVLDVTDHVWTEVFSEHRQRWLHCDSCEDQLDCPLTYEVGWGKKLSYIFSFAHDHVVDTARRYTQNWDDMKTRRTDVSEAWLARTIEATNHSFRTTMPTERRALLDARAVQEERELGAGRQANAAEVQGRVSGSDEWKSQRNEDGKQSDTPTMNEIKAPGARPTTTLSTVEMTQLLMKVMLLGCERGAECSNPRCATKRTARLPPTLSPTDRAALALQEIAQLQPLQLSPWSMGSLLCPSIGSIEDFILSSNPELYLPLQDAEGLVVVDVSGNNRHTSSDVPRRKPFRIASASGKESIAAGIQLLPTQRVALPVLPVEGFTNGLVLSWLTRLDGSIHQQGARVLRVQLGEQASVAVSDRQGGHLEIEVVTAASMHKADSSLGLRPGLHYHFSVEYVRATGTLTVYINGKTAVKVKHIVPFESIVQTISFENVSQVGAAGSATVPVISHIALLPFTSDDATKKFNDTMQRCFVCWPPLQAFTASGIDPSKTCSVEQARLQSGYRVSRVNMWGNAFFDGLQLVYEKQLEDGSIHSVKGPLMGNKNARAAATSPTVTAALHPSEFITKITGRKGAWTDCVRVETNFGRRFECGGSGGGEFEVKSPPGATHQIRAISFDVGDHLVDAVAFTADAPAPQSDELFIELTKILKAVRKNQQSGVINAVIRYLDNIAKSPVDPKFQKIKTSNKFFATSVGVMESSTVQNEFMSWSGFVPRTEHGEAFYVFDVANHSDVGRVAAVRVYFLKAYMASQ